MNRIVSKTSSDKSKEKADYAATRDVAAVVADAHYAEYSVMLIFERLLNAQPLDCCESMLPFDRLGYHSQKRSRL